ncbi:hypothetical protein KIPB_007191, partial [Kipferlia bialata]
QDTQYRAGKLSQVHIDKLNSINFPWGFTVSGWDKSFMALQRHRGSHGKWPSEAEDKTLYEWAEAQRILYVSGKLPVAKACRLESIDFPLREKETESSSAWDVNLATLRRHLTTRDKLSPETEREMTRWCKYQRGCKRKGTLSKRRIDLLNSIGFVWDPREQLWDDTILELQQYLQTHTKWPGHDSPSLSGWVYRARHLRREGRLSDERLAALDALGIDWNPNGKRSVEAIGEGGRSS